jgi:hypothetical protein
MINLTSGSACEFYHDPQNPKNRFKVWFNPSHDIINNISPETYYSVYSNGNQVTVVKNTSLDVSGEMVVYSMLGQPVLRETLVSADKTTIRINAPSGYYIVSIITDQHISNSKILIYN